MCNGCTWHHKAFLVQLYWPLAIKLYFIVLDVSTMVVNWSKREYSSLLTLRRSPINDRFPSRRTALNGQVLTCRYCLPKTTSVATIVFIQVSKHWLHAYSSQNFSERNPRRKWTIITKDHLRHEINQLTSRQTHKVVPARAFFRADYH